MRAAVLDSTHSMYQCEILGALLLLKLLVSDLWTLPWTVMAIEALGPLENPTPTCYAVYFLTIYHIIWCLLNIFTYVVNIHIQK